jgi:NAD(P)-dependent dehydrogenase (short-subunit alcohol dehydrogenase family)
MGRLEGKVAVITGGASGIGEATVRLFAAEGARVLIADVNDERGPKLAAELGAGAAYEHTDVRDEAQVQAAVEAAKDSWGRLDCIFNNAGVAGVTGGIEAIGAVGFDDTMALLVRGVLFGMKHAAPVMRRQGSGSIISTASVAGLRGGWGPHVYSAAKAAVIQLTKCVAMELGESNIRVNSISPGAIATGIFGKALGLSTEAAEKTPAVMREVYKAAQPIPRAGLAEDIAHAAVFLASDESSFVNGHDLVVDGAITGGRNWTQQQQGYVALRKAFDQGT